MLEGTEVRFHLDSNGEDLTVQHTQDVEAIIERNKALQAMAQKSDWGRHVASIPNVILMRWLDEEAAKGNTTIRLFTPEFDELVDRKLKDPEWKYLRTDSAHVNGFLGFGS